MEFNRRRLISAAGGTLLLSLAPWQIASGAKLVNVRMWPAEEYTRVTIETDEPLKFKHFFVRSASPLRLVIDIEGLALTERVKRLIADVKPDDPYISAMRIGQFKPGVVRLVMDLKADVKPEVFLLKPFANYQYRLVFDIYPVHPKDEIGAILAGSQEGNLLTDSLSSSNSEDPLADVLAGLANPNAPKTRPALSASKGKDDKAAKKPSAKDTQTPAKSAPAKKTQSEDQIIIVVDPGHGGEDPGAIGRRKTQEKVVVLQIARRLAKLISAEPGMKAVLTRNSDHFVSLGGLIFSSASMPMPG